jgi:hypothetical protein
MIYVPVTVLTSAPDSYRQIGSSYIPGDRMARKQQKGVVQTAAVLAATALLERVVQKAAEDPRVRRQARAAGKKVAKSIKATTRKISKNIKRRRSTRS